MSSTSGRASSAPRHAAERAEIEGELAEARAAIRAERAAHVPKPILTKYERILEPQHVERALPAARTGMRTMRHGDPAAAPQRRSRRDARSKSARRAECFCTRRDDACCSPHVDGNFRPSNAPAARTRPPLAGCSPAPPMRPAVSALANELRLPPLSARCSLRRGFAHRGRRQALPAPAPRPAARTRRRCAAWTPRSPASCARCAMARRSSCTATTTSTGCAPPPSSCARCARLGADAIPFIPRRLEDGYDLSLAGRARRHRRGRRVARHLRLRHQRPRARRGGAARAGIDVIVIDHHLAGRSAAARAWRC